MGTNSNARSRLGSAGLFESLIGSVSLANEHSHIFIRACSISDMLFDEENQERDKRMMHAFGVLSANIAGLVVTDNTDDLIALATACVGDYEVRRAYVKEHGVDGYVIHRLQQSDLCDDVKRLAKFIVSEVMEPIQEAMAKMFSVYCKINDIPQGDFDATAPLPEAYVIAVSELAWLILSQDAQGIEDVAREAVDNYDEQVASVNAIVNDEGD